LPRSRAGLGLSRLESQFLARPHFRKGSTAARCAFATEMRVSFGENRPQAADLASLRCPKSDTGRSEVRLWLSLRKPTQSGRRWRPFSAIRRSRDVDYHNFQTDRCVSLDYVQKIVGLLCEQMATYRQEAQFHLLVSGWTRLPSLDARMD